MVLKSSLHRCIRIVPAIYQRIFRLGLGSLATYRLTGRMWPIKVRFISTRMRLVILKARSSRVILNGTLEISPWLGNYQPVVISLGDDAEFRIDGDFLLGANCRISVGIKASLVLGGRQCESASGITENAIILVAKSIEIGKDFLGAWGLFITDADHHQYGDANPPISVNIGDHVWMCPESSVLKGACIGANSVITQRAVVLCGVYPDCSLLGGMPARRIGTAKVWHR